MFAVLLRIVHCETRQTKASLRSCTEYCHGLDNLENKITYFTERHRRSPNMIL